MIKKIMNAVAKRSPAYKKLTLEYRNAMLDLASVSAAYANQNQADRSARLPRENKRVTARASSLS